MRPTPSATSARRARGISWLALLLSSTACGAGSHPAAAAPCDQTCQDSVALLGERSMMKVAFNATVQGKPVGAQDGVARCVPSATSHGSVHVFGDATANAAQGSSFLDLTYNFSDCTYSAPPDPTADQNYSLVLNGIVTEVGTLAVQPSSTTALQILSDSLTVTGTVYDPPIDYGATSCELALIQNGNALSGTLCGRAAGVTF